MRHLFDQYSQPENRLTHALVSCLAHDARLLRRFIAWVTETRVPSNQHIHVTEQSLPGKEEVQVTEEEAEQRGLPDACIQTDEGWTLLIESKIAASPSRDQLERHLRTARKRGVSDLHLLFLTVEGHLDALPETVTTKAWREVYTWVLRQSADSSWARELATYLEIAEVKMVRDGYLREGTLTKFAGIRFDDAYPYAYLEAKRILSLLMAELRQSTRLREALGVDSELPGRKAIKGQKETRVWDYLRLKESKTTKRHTAYPHLTVYLEDNALFAVATLPNGVRPEIRQRILGRGFKVFKKLLQDVAREMEQVIALEPHAKPQAEVLQRHYPSQSQPSIPDARLWFDLRTIRKPRRRTQVKSQPEWLEVSYAVLTHKTSNVQLALGVEIPYRQARLIEKAEAVMVVETAFLALKPFVDAALGRR